MTGIRFGSINACSARRPTLNPVKSVCVLLCTFLRAPAEQMRHFAQRSRELLLVRYVGKYLIILIPFRTIYAH